MRTPTRTSHQRHASPLHDINNLPPFSLPRELGEKGQFLSPEEALGLLRTSKAGFIGKHVAYLVDGTL